MIAVCTRRRRLSVRFARGFEPRQQGLAKKRGGPQGTFPIQIGAPRPVQSVKRSRAVGKPAGLALGACTYDRGRGCNSSTQKRTHDDSSIGSIL
jgi:hypothetical protein